MIKTIYEYIKIWESRCYPDGIPDEAPPELESANKVPSYKRIVRAILKNDTCLFSLGFSKKKTQIYDMLKKQELGIRQERDIQYYFRWE